MKIILNWQSVKIALIAFAYTPLVFSQEATEKMSKKTADRPSARIEHEISITADPTTQKIPFEELEKSRQAVDKKLRTLAAIPGVTWTERGPNNVGGRTRALMFDPNDATKKKVWAGGVAGGVWYNNDITLATSSWTKIDDFWDNLAITCIVADPSNSQIFYAGTGEGFSNIDAVVGGGVWKTSDGGTTWSRLASTIPDPSASSSTVAGAFNYVYKIVVNSSGHVFVGTKGGILKSSDGGTTWSFVFGPGAGGWTGSHSYSGDLEIGTDDIIYVGVNPNRVFKASNTAGTTWTEITPVGATGGGRVELGLAPSTSGATQVVYAAAAGGATHAWVYKTANAGSSWSTLTVPDFSGNQGWYDFILAVHPTNANIVVAGGTNFIRTTNGGVNWTSNSYGAFGHPDMHNIVFRPNAPNEAIYGNDGGVFYCTDFGNSATAFPSTNFSSRNKDYNVTQYYGVAQKNISAENYFLAGAQDNGTHKIASSGVGTGTSVMGGDGMLGFIDQDNPNIQIASYQWNNHNLLNASGAIVATLVGDNDGGFVNPADYDWVNDIFYSYKSNSGGITKISRVLNVGSTNTRSDISINTGISVSFIKVAKAANTLFLGKSSGLYKITNTNSTPVATEISGGNFIGSVSCIEIGASDNELLVTISNYNTKNVWYTNNGGTTWISKDETSYGLPNIPVRYAIFNPNNRQQVMLATELGVWSTNEFTATNPGWTISSTNLAKVSCYMLRYRSSDGQVAVGTHGRGVFTTNVFASGIVADIQITSPLASTYCVGQSFNVAFVASGTYNVGNTFTLQLSDATGSFASPTTLGTTSISPFSNISLPSLPAGAAYKLRVVATNPVLQGTPSSAFSINTGNVVFASGMPNVGYATAKGFMLNVNTTTNSQLYYVLVADNATAPSNGQINNGLNAEGYNAIISSSTNLTANLTQSLMISGLVSGTSYDLYYIAKDLTNGCVSPTIAKLDISTSGTAPSYCTPAYSSGCTTYKMYISEFYINDNLVNAEDQCETGSFEFVSSSAINMTAGSSVSFYAALYFNGGYYYSPGQGLAIWIDANQNGTFESGEKVYNTSSTSYEAYGNFTIPATALQGLTRMRVRSVQSSTPTDPCASYTYGETEDYLVFIQNNSQNPMVYTDINQATVGRGVTMPVYFNTAGTFNAGNTYEFELSDNTGSFAAPVSILASYSGTSPATITIPVSSALGTGYKVRAKSSNPAVTGFETATFEINSNCPPTLIITNNVTSGTNLFNASVSVTASNQVTNTAQTTYRAGNYILLTPNFKAEPASGGAFKTELGGCN